MATNRVELAEALLRLKDNANFAHYVRSLEAHYNDRMTALVSSPHPDEALRGECRALRTLLLNINRHNGDLT
ncbi:MAG TPA: hypothetical protein VIJ38_02125 [Acidobacteriaceae bacterium]